jgi:pyrroloquinoline quinone biosynthesis protein B
MSMRAKPAACVLHLRPGMNILLPGGDAVPPSIAVSPDDRRWVLLNASAEAVREAHLRCAATDGTIVAVVLLDRHFDHTAGLHGLCDGAPLAVYTTPAVFEGLADAAPTLGLLEGRCTLRWHLLPVAGDVRSAEFRIPGVEGLHCRVLAADDVSSAGECVLIEVDDLRTGQCLVYAGGEQPRWIEALREHGT